MIQNQGPSCFTFRTRFSGKGINNTPLIDHERQKRVLESTQTIPWSPAFFRVDWYVPSLFWSGAISLHRQSISTWAGLIPLPWGLQGQPHVNHVLCDVMCRENQTTPDNCIFQKTYHELPLEPSSCTCKSQHLLWSAGVCVPFSSGFWEKGRKNWESLSCLTPEFLWSLDVDHLSLLASMWYIYPMYPPITPGFQWKVKGLGSGSPWLASSGGRSKICIYHYLPIYLPATGTQEKLLWVFRFFFGSRSSKGVSF